MTNTATTMTTSITAAAEVVNDLPERWEAVLAVEDERTTDGREIAPDALTWRELPISLLWLTGESHGGLPIAPSVVVGQIDQIERVGNEIRGRGSFDLGSEDGREAARLVQEQVVRWVSIDVEVLEEEILEEGDCDLEQHPDGDCQFIARLLEGRIMGVTMVAFSAFPGAVIVPEGQTIPEATEDGRPVVTAGPTGGTVTDEDWDGSAGRFTDEQWEMSSAACESGDGTVKQRCFMPHHEPGGVINRNGVHAAAQRFSALERPADAKDRAAAHLRSHYTQDLDEEPPDVIAASIQAQAYAAAAPEGIWRLAGLTAAAAPSVVALVPPAQWFTDPDLGELQRYLTVTDDGRVYGHLAGLKECHIGYSGTCVEPPREEDYPYFHVGQVATSGGELVATGAITLKGGHAGLSLNAPEAQRHYDDTDSAVADVRAGTDANGIWLAGALRPGATPEQVRILRASGVSGDWRSVGGRLRLIAVCSVNTPGYPKLAARVASGRVMALIAAGGRPTGDPEVCGCGFKELARKALATSERALRLARVGFDRDRVLADIRGVE